MNERRCGRLASGVAVVLLLFLGLWKPALAQSELKPEEPSSESPSEQMTDEPADAESEPDGGGASQRQEPRRRVFKRIGPQEVTPEQREEAERLRKLGAKYGTDPTAIVGRVQLSSQYQDLVQGARATDTTLRVDVPFRKDFLLRVDTPFLRWIDPDRPGTTSAQGMSDLATVLGWRAYSTPEYALFIGALSTFPTAATGNLGTGKYTTGPFLATARFLPRWDSFLFGVFQHQVSVGGDPSRADISISRALAQINSFWAERWWTIVQGVWQVNWERNAKSSMTMEFELGRSLVGPFGAYVRPGVGIWGRDLAGAYQWNIEVGVRYMFGSF